MTTVYVDRYGVKHVAPYSFNYRIIRKEAVGSKERKVYQDEHSKEQKEKNVSTGR